MTQKKADSDPWLTDPVSRDREVSKSVVYGMRTIISLLRAIRDEQAESRAIQVELRETRQEVRDLWEQVARGQVAYVPASDRARYMAGEKDFPRCVQSSCTLPQGHYGAHRGSLRSA